MLLLHGEKSFRRRAGKEGFSVGSRRSRLWKTSKALGFTFLAICVLLQSCALPILPPQQEESSLPESSASVSSRPKSSAAPQSTIPEEPEKEPAFLSAGISLEENLRKLALEDAKEEEYLYVKPLGKEKLLLILEQMLSSGKFQVRLKAYDPYEGREREKTLSLERGGGSIQTVGNLVYVWNEDTLQVYDENLSLQKSCKVDFAYISYWVSGNGKKIYAEDISGKLYSGDIPADGRKIHFQPFFEGFYNVRILGEGDGTFFLDAVDPRTLRRETYLVDASGGYVMEKLGQYAPVEAGFSLGEDGSEICVLKEGSSVFCRSPETGAEEKEYAIQSYISLDKAGGYLIGEQEAGEETCFSAYNPEGEWVSSFLWDGEKYGYISATGGSGYFPEDSCLVLSYNGTEEKGLVFWFLKEDAKKPAKPDLEKVEKNPQTTPTSGAKAMEENYKRAENLGKKYGLEIQVGEKIHFTPSDFTIEKEMDPQKVSQALHELEQALDRYPEGFFEQLCYEDMRGIKVALTGTLMNSGNPDAISEAGGYVKTAGKYTEVAVSISQGEGSVYSTIYHEISHLIDNRLTYADLVREDCLFSEEAWNSYNPPDFSYDYAYNGAHYSNGDRDDRYFLDSYSMTYPTEDRAVLMSMAMTVDADAPWNPFASSPGLLEKYTYYCQCIRDGFDDQNWPEVTAWEETPAFLGRQLQPAA